MKLENSVFFVVFYEKVQLMVINGVDLTLGVVNIHGTAINNKVKVRVTGWNFVCSNFS